MRKLFRFTAMLFMASMVLVGCDQKNTPEQPEQQQPVTPTDTTVQPADTVLEPIPASFPRKHLIEEFTGQTCGYCPEGMNSVHEFIKNDSNFIVVLHHDGYSPDHFTVAGSSVITKELKVSGAPNIAIDRNNTTYGTQSAVVFHPGYLPEVSMSQFEESTYASVVINNTYDAASRQLKVTVSGALCNENYPQLNLNVLVKESGMVDTQSDYYYTFAGWQEFRHTNAVRAFLTDAKGDALTIDTTRRYKVEYTLTLDSKWVPENCMVVAFLSEAFKPVVQVEQQPVVAGSKGGADILHGGITPVPVADYYPEPNATDGPAAYSKKEEQSLGNAKAHYEQYPAYNLTMWTIQAFNYSPTVKIGGTNCVPFINVYLFTEYSATPTLPTGTFPFNTTQQAGTAWAGYRTETPPDVGGSMFYFVSLVYLQNSRLYPLVEWLIADGEMIISDTGWSINGHARNGSDIKVVGTGAIQNGGSNNAPARRCARVPYIL